MEIPKKWYKQRLREAEKALKEAKYPGPISERIEFYKAKLLEADKQEILKVS